MNKVKLFFIATACLLSCETLASATSHDYKKCKVLAVKYLDACLKQQGDFTGPKCWDGSKREYDRCMIKVKKMYSNEGNEEYIKAKKAAELRAKEAKEAKEAKQMKHIFNTVISKH